jgi:hypothetical protein
VNPRYGSDINDGTFASSMKLTLPYPSISYAYTSVPVELEFIIAWFWMAVRIDSLRISAWLAMEERVFVAFKMMERRWRLTDNMAFPGMNSWNIVASSEGRKEDRMSPTGADGEPYPASIN